MRRLSIALCILVFIAALGLTVYPLVSNYCAERYQSTAMTAYAEAVSSMDDTTLVSARQAAEKANEELGTVSLGGPDALSLLNKAAEGYDDLLNVNADGIMGYIRIPVIDVALPIYHGVEGDTLELGVGHMPGSSLPIGGMNTHAVLAAHSGLASQRMFTDLEQMQLGDIFYIDVLGDTLAYEVDQILVVEPDDTSALSREAGQDYVTLITCTPYGINTHRLLVRGRRVPYTPAQEETTEAEVTAEPSTWRQQYIKGLALGFGILAGLGSVSAVSWRIYRIRLPRRRYKHEYFEKRRASRAKCHALISLFCALFLLGLVIFLWPRIMGARLTHRASVAISEFYDMAATEVQDTPDVSIGYVTGPTATPTPKPYAELYEAMEQYNAHIYASGQSGLCDAWSYQQASFDLTSYGVADGAMGVISIPKMDVELPIYLGATYDNMAAGAVHLSQTSLPIGGINTNCVIAAHRGWYSAPYFRYIDLLEAGDEVYVTNLWETLTYKVTSIKIIEPDDINEILIQPGRDMLTLLTCHPYASGGRYRYVVYCDRVMNVG